MDLDGLDNQEFWKDYWDNGLVGTAMYFLPHLAAMPERAGAALSAIVSAPPGGLLFHCMGGRYRTGMIAMLLLAAVGTEPEQIVSDYLETVRLGDLRAATANRNNPEPEIDAFCRAHGTSTEGAFRTALAGLDLRAFLDAAKVSRSDREALATWREPSPTARHPADRSGAAKRKASRKWKGWPPSVTRTLPPAETLRPDEATPPPQPSPRPKRLT